jgi:hypothetical protein
MQLEAVDAGRCYHPHYLIPGWIHDDRDFRHVVGQRANPVRFRSDISFAARKKIEPERIRAEFDRRRGVLRRGQPADFNRNI